MVQGKKEKITILILSAVILLLCLCPVGIVGLHEDSSVYERLLYPFFHANIFHALLNIWCILSIVFRYKISWRDLLASYIIAISYPDNFLNSQTIVGFSGVCFAALGVLSFRVERRAFFQISIWAFVCLGVFFQNIAAGLHAYCLIMGLFISIFNTPINELWQKKR